MDCYNLINSFVQILHGKNRGVDGTDYDAKFAKSKRGRGRGGRGKGGIDEEEEDGKGQGCCAWLWCGCQCCNCWGTGEDDLDDEHLNAAV